MLTYRHQKVSVFVNDLKELCSVNLSVDFFKFVLCEISIANSVLFEHFYPTFFFVGQCSVLFLVSFFKCSGINTLKKSEKVVHYRFNL